MRQLFFILLICVSGLLHSQITKGLLNIDKEATVLNAGSLNLKFVKKSNSEVLVLINNQTTYFSQYFGKYYEIGGKVEVFMGNFDSKKDYWDKINIEAMNGEKSGTLEMDMASGGDFYRILVYSVSDGKNFMVNYFIEKK